MPNINKQLVSTIGIGLVSGIVVAIIALFAISISNRVDPINLGPITIASLSYENNSQIPVIRSSLELPYTGVEAIAAGLEDPVLCRFGRGKYFLSDGFYKDSEYRLIYNYNNQLTGIYLYTENIMPNPWLKIDELRGGGGTIVVEKEHYGLFVFFRDPDESCKGSVGANTGDGTSIDWSATGKRSSPTPYVEPTPTPMPSDLVTGVVTQLGKETSLTVTITTEPENISVASDSEIKDKASELPKLFADIISGLTDVEHASNTWIDNVSYKGVSGTYTAQSLSTLVPGAVDGNIIKVSAWVSDKGVLRRISLEGALTSDDSASAVRTFDISK